MYVPGVEMAFLVDTEHKIKVMETEAWVSLEEIACFFSKKILTLGRFL
jgi:hypothetical protein